MSCPSDNPTQPVVVPILHNTIYFGGQLSQEVQQDAVRQFLKGLDPAGHLSKKTNGSNSPVTLSQQILSGDKVVLSTHTCSLSWTKWYNC